MLISMGAAHSVHSRASGNPETISFWVPAFALVHAHIFEVGRDGVAGTIPPPAESALTRVFDALWRWGGWRGAGRQRAGWGVVQLRTNAPHPRPLPTTRAQTSVRSLRKLDCGRSRGEGSGEARRVAFEMCACASATAGTQSDKLRRSNKSPGFPLARE